MISDDKLKEQLQYTLNETDLKIGEKYDGKVRDSYTIDDNRIIITTDRISAFDRVLCTLPFKGQVLNQLAAFWFERTKGTIPNHFIEMPDPNVLLAHECKLVPIEIIVRGYLTGSTKTSAWYNYKNGVREFCGNTLPEGMTEHQKFETPIITPTTKAPKGEHDESISKKEILEQGLVKPELYEQIEKVALELFKIGTEHLAKNNLILVDTKYEFGLLDGKLVLIDEIHTPDSSRFWIKDTYESRLKEGKDPQKLDKEYVRKYLADQGFLGDGDIPEIPEDVKIEAAKRYIQAYEMITGKQFEAEVGDVSERIKKNLGKFLE